MTDIWLFVEHGKRKIWTRAFVPHSIQNVRDLITYLQRGGKVESDWLELPKRAHYLPRAIGLTVIASFDMAKT